MTAAQMAAVAAVATPETPEERVVRVRAALERWGILGVVAEVALAHEVALDELLGRTRIATVVRARHAAWSRLYRELFWSGPQLASVFAVDDSSVSKALVRLAAAEVSDATAAA